jgi:L-seryl-tRNA(Ser) seleniumtransferase
VAADLRRLPAVHRFLADPSVAGYMALLGSAFVKSATVRVLREARARAARDALVPPYDALLSALHERLSAEEAAGLLEVLNGTGILLHTNLGRAPLAQEALEAARAIGGGYSNLEFDLDAGSRGSRYERVSSLLRAASGAEDALVVNNCAAAVLLVLDTFARGRDVIASRTALIEIGGGFRLPDVVQRSGARLVEVGATNRVYLHDFERALGPETALLLLTHPSNYRIEGFTAGVAPNDVGALGRRIGLPVVEDLGSGALVDLAAFGLEHERTVSEAIADGIDLVAFSGDKLLGGPQAGIIVGRSALVARMRANPLLRALRVDKATLAALAATLRLHLEPGGVAHIPLYAMLATTVEALESRARVLCETLRRLPAAVETVRTTAYAGGGALPLAAIESAGVSVAPHSGDPNALARALRSSRPPLVARTEGRAVLVDLRAIPERRDAEVAAAFVAALEP